MILEKNENAVCRVRACENGVQKRNEDAEAGHRFGEISADAQRRNGDAGVDRGDVTAKDTAWKRSGVEIRHRTFQSNRYRAE